MRWVLGVVGAAAVLGSLFGLTLPLSLQVVDRSGVPISCGTGYHPDHHFAAREDALNGDLHIDFGAPYEPSDYASQCEALVAAQRGITFSVLVFGATLLTAALLLSLRAAGYLNRVEALAIRSRRALVKRRTNRVLKPAASPPPVRYLNDLEMVRHSLGIRVQH